MERVEYVADNVLKEGKQVGTRVLNKLNILPENLSPCNKEELLAENYTKGTFLYIYVCYNSVQKLVPRHDSDGIRREIR